MYAKMIKKENVTEPGALKNAQHQLSLGQWFNEVLTYIYLEASTVAEKALTQTTF